MDRNSEEDDDELDEKSYFPGLNKAHGFFSMIERNQKDRDSYHQEMEEWKQVLPYLEIANTSLWANPI